VTQRLSRRPFHRGDIAELRTKIKAAERHATP
jgi:uncharacterized protein YdhG (YjbR/CyaY superfamily)